MKRTALSIALATVVFGGLAACGNTSDTQSLNGNDRHRFANEAYDMDQRLGGTRNQTYNFQGYGGNAPINGDRVGLRGENQQQFVTNRSILQKQNRTMSYNYHPNYDGTLANKITKNVTAMNGVRDARVIVSGNDVVVGIDTTRASDRDFEKRVKAQVENIARNKNVYVVTDRDGVDKIRSVDERLRTGTPFEKVGDTVSDMIQDLANAAKRPFENFR